MMTLYGIPNCDSIRKARQWLDEHGVVYTFHNYKTEGLDTRLLAEWLETLGWRAIVNTRGTTWRKLAISESDMDQGNALPLIAANLSLIKRPLVTSPERVIIGLDDLRRAVS